MRMKELKKLVAQDWRLHSMWFTINHNFLVETKPLISISMHSCLEIPDD